MATDTALMEIARCEQLLACLGGAEEHPCAAIVRSQRALEGLTDPSVHQLPEPWVGHLDSAPILFLSSNPSIDPNEDFPTLDWSDSKIAAFFTNRFETEAIRDGTHHRRSDGTYGRSHYWSEIRNRASELLGRPAVPGRDYALSEVVHCKSKRQFGVPAALSTCMEAHFEKVLGLSRALLIVCVADQAAQAIESRYSILLPGGRLAGPFTILGRERLFLRLPGPGSSGVRRLDKVMALADLSRIHAIFASRE